ncbi:DinB family protein [Mycobacterium sp. 29Ha]|uniref:DinB family protein n=1 Tax=Mycobacterium sp. 29Ha TaxID=2939268 RepID=UPI0029394E81|nr:DinB family protein [Mycobacterium sp. 29Ha]MDV3132919.1 DinB family protein [Mycobacterium sp. 29Ha]
MEEICTECHFDESATPPREVPAALASLKIEISDSIRSIPGDELRRRPAPTVWSPVEYLGHLRESMAFHRWLIERAVSEDNPHIPAVDPDKSVAQAEYVNADPDELLTQFDRRIRRLCEALTSLDEAAAVRTLTLDHRRVAVALVARSAWHECHHHLRDIRRIGRLE